MPRYQANYWCFTDFEKTLVDKLKNDNNVRYIHWQLEECPTTKKQHYQGFVQLIKKQTMKTMKQICPKAHWEMTKGSEAQNMAYTSKGYTKIEGPFEHGVRETQGARTDLKMIATEIKEKGFKDVVKENPEFYLRCGKRLKELDEIINPPKLELPDIELYEWQINLINIFEEKPQRRKIYWIWSQEPGTGKSTFQDYCLVKFNTLIGSSEIKRTLYAYSDHKIIWFDVARTQPLDANFTSQLESLSNQTMLLSEMYNPIMKKISAHIVVTTNRPPPPYQRLTDRIYEVHIGHNGVIHPTTYGKEEVINID